MSAEPLHVRVARALGWTEIQSIGPRQHGPSWHASGEELWVGLPPGFGDACANLARVPVRGGIRDLAFRAGHYDPIPPYGRESPEGWAVTGPLIQRFRITLEHWIVDMDAGPVRQFAARDEITVARHELAVVAICNVIVGSAAVGRLRKEHGAAAIEDSVLTECERCHARVSAGTALATSDGTMCPSCFADGAAGLR